MLATLGLSVIYFEMGSAEHVYPPEWPRQFRILIALFALSSAVALLIDRPGARLPAILVQFIAYGLVAVAQGPSIGVTLLLLICLSIELCMVAPLSLVPPAGLLLVTLPFMRPQEYRFFDVQYSVGPGSEQLVFAGVAVTLIAALTTTRFYHDRAHESRAAHAQLNDTVHRLTSANVQFQEYAATAESRSMIEERNRLSSELHDAVGYTLTNIIMLAQAAKDLLSTDAGRSRQMLETTRVQAEEGLAETRRALRALRETGAPRLSTTQKVTKLINAFSASTNVSVQLEYGNVPPRFPPRVEKAMYRTIQEGLTNAFRHGKATEVMILFWRDDSRMQVTVEDNGCGLTSVTEGIGVKGMRQRIEPLGGRVRLENGHQGARLVAWVPASCMREEHGNDAHHTGG